jgi:flagellar hook protein FlgE
MSIESQDGHASGTLQSYSIGSDGIIRGSFSSGTTLNLGQIALASFANPSGLADNGGGLYSATANSGQANVGAASSGARGSLLGGELEQSNVNLGSELTNLIGAQEAYQANTKVLTSTQQVIQALESVA